MTPLPPSNAARADVGRASCPRHSAGVGTDMPEPVPGGGPGDPWMEAMRRGDFEFAWAISDRVLEARRGTPCFHLPRHEQYLWDGQLLAGKRVLVRCYHGLGDTVQFIRYAPLLRQIATEVIVWAQPCLLTLLQGVAGIDRVLPLHDGVPEVEFDADVEVMELPHIFRTTLETIPAKVPYVRIDAGRDRPIPPTAGDRIRRFRPASDQPDVSRRVGLIWQSGGWDDRRSIPTALLEPLTRVPGIELHALQLGAALKQWPAEWGPVSATEDVAVLAQRMLSMDRVISVDSFPAHLAGALAVPSWTLLHADPDWRWMLGRTDSPWYPTMRLWRQASAGDWSSVIDAVADALRLR